MRTKKKGKYVECEVCGKEVYRIPSQLKHEKYFCSNKCHGIYGRNGNMIKCDNCGKEFYRKSSQIGNKTFCSKECYFDFINSTVEKKCAFCEKYFKSLESDNAKYCSKKCKRKSKENGKIINCDTCSKSFYRSLSLIKENNYCSRKCYGKANENLVSVECSFCGKVFFRRKSALGYDNLFCSKKCQYNYYSSFNNPNWSGGYHPYPKEWNEELKNTIRKRDNYRCQLCGVSQIECIEKLCVHHIDYNKDNLEKNNLISLCRKCHIKTNFNKEYWENFFNGKLQINI